ncbi:uncharacterized protein APUU_41271A [Aspergillus puulaauensis]|uniref:Uncharacterized protein n=1 Tax=Aspergillus puulaauensis TaxID=1220207 RepID=A0A7R7XP75_9EURO|nr:uncharacterized protein APUU_41271A [Aspergillus puulaauensis]BCS24827.1 hypothetical protein APUU_41271A [Aspergillus puulaauensis]
MASFILCFVLALLSPAFSLQPHNSPPKTTSTADAEPGPSPTEPPLLEKRADFDDVPPNICGWFSGAGYDTRWSYDNPQITCFWNSDYKILGRPEDQVPAITTCIEDGNAGISTLRCSSDTPYCLTVIYEPDYYGWFCTDTPDVTWTMEPTWSGMQSPILFPIYTGSKGISTGTQYPPGYQNSQRTSTVDSAGEPSDTDTGTDTGSDTASSSVPVGAIVGGVVGGLAAIGIFAFAVIYLLIHSRRKRSNAEQQGQGPGQPPEIQKTQQGYVQPDMPPPSEVHGQGAALSPGQPELPSNTRPSPFSPYVNQGGYPGTAAPPRGQWAGDGRNFEIDSQQVGELDGANYISRPSAR